MRKLLYILKNRPGVLLFLVAVITGVLLIVWFFRGDEEDLTGTEPVSEEIKVYEAGEKNSTGISNKDKAYIIPAGFKAVNLPVNFFGDRSVLNEGDCVDIISTCYDRDKGMISSEKIISKKKVIHLNYENGTGTEDYDSIRDSIIPGDLYLSGTAIDSGKILIITFFLKDDEVLRSFTALESGILYLAICNDGKEPGKNY